MKFVLILVVVCAGCARRAPLPIYGQVPDFELTAQSGEAIQRKMLDGKIWVADFIFTHCSGPCPRMSAQMSQVQRSVTGVKLVSFTVDPARDTPQVLAAYAQRFHADPGRWLFLTGPQPTLHMLQREAFKLGNVDGSLNHSTRFVLVDRRGRIRGYYGTADDSWRNLLPDIKTLSAEGS